MTTIILVITCLISFIAFQNRKVFDRMIFNPYIIHHRNQWYRFLSSGLIHADWFHLIINMFVLYSFGSTVEFYFNQYFDARGPVNFFLLYFGGMMMSVVPTFSKNKDNPAYHALGASGAVSAIVFSFILFNPMQSLCLYGLLCLPGIIFGILYLAYCYYMSRKGGDNINHDAHFWGALYGIFFTLLLKPALFQSFISKLMDFRHGI